MRAVIRDQLAGKRIAVTGSTGFLGTALVERLLRSVPDCELVLLVRRGRMRSVEQRAQREIFKNDCFDRLRDDVGGKAAFDELIARRVQVVAGDVATDGLGLDDAGRAAIASCDIVIHSAAAVSFDSPIDLAVEVNLLGPTRIAQTLTELGVAPHLVAVSTCYVAGHRRGAAPEILVDESPFWVDVDWRAEVDGARRRPGGRGGREPYARLLERFTRRSPPRARCRRHSAPRGKERAEAINLGQDQRVNAGRSRAASLGWPDAYAMTKALGERALAENRGAVPVSDRAAGDHRVGVGTSRCPGWIRGFRMAEPVIISYARGLLREFPGVPEGTVDVIPVDLVVGAISRGRRPGAGERRRLARHHPGRVGLGQPTPLPAARRSRRTWFNDHPLYDNAGQPIMVPSGRSRAGAACSASWSGPSDLLARAEQVAAVPPAARHARPSGRPRWRRSARWPSGHSPTSSSTARTPSARRSTASTDLLALHDDARRRGPRRVLLRPTGHRLGPTTSTTSTSRRSWSTPGFAPTPGAARRRVTRMTVSDARSSSPNATSRRSTSRTRSSRRTS